jgi:hypothetical protein
MNKIISLFILILQFPAVLISQDEPNGRGTKAIQSSTVTYIANEGFLIETPNHKHSDHFNESLCIEFLINNKKSVLICPDQVNEMLKRNTGFPKVSDRIHSFKSDTLFDTKLPVNDIDIRALRFKHGSWTETDSVTGKSIDLHRDVENFGYLIDADGFIFLHTGDCNAANKSQFTAYNLFDTEIDVAFFDRVFLSREGMKILNEFTSIKDLVFMHIEPNRREYYQSVINNIPGLYIFSKQMEKKTVSK